MKIAVTGASGNLGSRVTRIAISHGHKVVGIDRAKPLAPPPLPEGASEEDEWFRFVEVDVREYDQVIEAFRGCDAVIHLAAIPNPGDYVVATHNLNVVASWNVLRGAAELGIERICQASSINAVGMVWGDNPLIDYLPMDESHPCRPEDPYSLSKLIAELQADTIIRRWPNMRIASLRLSWAVPNREYAMGREMDWVRKELWSWIDAEESARSFVLGVTAEHPDFTGHQVFFTIAPTTCQEEPTAELIADHWPNAELRKEFTGHESLYDCSKAARLLGWVHHDHNGLAPDVPPPTAAVPVEPAAQATESVELPAVETQPAQPEPAPLSTPTPDSAAVETSPTPAETTAPAPVEEAVTAPLVAVASAPDAAPSTFELATAVAESQISSEPSQAATTTIAAAAAPAAAEATPVSEQLPPPVTAEPVIVAEPTTKIDVSLLSRSTDGQQQEQEVSSPSSTPSSDVDADDATSSLESVESLTELPSDDFSQDEGDSKAIITSGDVAGLLSLSPATPGPEEIILDVPIVQLAPVVVAPPVQ